MTHARDRFSLIGHSALPFMSPLTEEELTRLLTPAALSPGDRVLDLGAGRGDLAVLLSRRFGSRVVSVDRSPAACEEAQRRTVGLDVDVRCEDAALYVRAAEPGSFALASAVGALHAFGSGIESWTNAESELGRIARRVVVADLVALGPHAAKEFEVAPLEKLTLRGRSQAHEILSPGRVHDYERAWADGLARHLEAHPDDPRADWARERIAWTEDPSLRLARSELAFAAFFV